MTKENQRAKNLKDSRRGRVVLGGISILVSFFLWLYVLNSAPVEVEKKIGIIYVLPKGYAAGIELPKEIKIQMKGPRAFLSSSFYEHQKIYVNFDSPEFKGRKYFDFKIDPEDIPHNVTVEIVKVTPDVIRVALAKKVSKTVPVAVRLNSKFDKNFKLENTKITPSEVEIEGPKEMVQSILKVETEILDSKDLEGKEELVVRLMPADGRLHLFVKENEGHRAIDSVQYHYLLRPKAANLILKNMAIDFQGADDLKFRPERNFVSLSVFTSKGAEKSLTKGAVRVVADIPSDAQGVVKVHLRAVLPEGVHLLRIYPEYISVMVDKTGHHQR